MSTTKKNIKKRRRVTKVITNAIASPVQTIVKPIVNVITSPNETIVKPFQHFLEQERAGGIVLGISVIIALILANSPWNEYYVNSLKYHFGFTIGKTPFLNYSLYHWINDGLMSIFFLTVGLELKQEFVAGELSSFRKALLPLGCALGGMVGPAVIYHLLNPSGPEAVGWGIPMATDIAFAVGVLYLIGNKVPNAFKIFLLALAIFDDMGSVIVIALFYSTNVSLAYLGTALIFTIALWLGNKAGVKNLWFYAIFGIAGVWYPFLMSGVHATIGAVVIAFTIPADAKEQATLYFDKIKRRMQQFGEMQPDSKGVLTDDQVHILADIKQKITDATPPLQRVEYTLHMFVTFVVLPIFALANAGVSFAGINPSELFNNNVILGVGFGLFFGKVLGIVGALLLLVKLKFAPMPNGMHGRNILGLGLLGAIGFTMSLFVTSLAFHDPLHLDQAKIGIFSASILGGLCAYLLLNRNKPVNPDGTPIEDNNTSTEKAEA